MKTVDALPSSGGGVRGADAPADQAGGATAMVNSKSALPGMIPGGIPGAPLAATALPGATLLDSPDAKAPPPFPQINGHKDTIPKVNGCGNVNDNVNGNVNGSVNGSVNGTDKDHELPLVNGTAALNGQPLVNGQSTVNAGPMPAADKAAPSIAQPTVNGQAKGLANGHEAVGLKTMEPEAKDVVNGYSGAAGGDASGVCADRPNSAPATVNGFALMKGAASHLSADADKHNSDGGGGGEDVSEATAWASAVAGAKGHKEAALARLQEELRSAHAALKLRDEEVTRLSRIREEVEAELEELTASLFQEAHNMVREANVRQAAAERGFKESQMQVEVLQAEVAALKTLVLTSTPARPNPHLHPQIADARAPNAQRSDANGVGLFNRKHRRSPSHFNLKYGRENSPPESPVKEQRPAIPPPDSPDSKDGWEVDPNIHKEFMAWKQNPKIDKSDPFIARIYKEDISLCLDFSNSELAAKVQAAVEEGNIFIEAVSDKSKTIFPKKCALLEAPRQCHYRMKLGDQEQWYYISQICRNRIIAVCDFLNYLRYIERGLVKSSVHDIYWEITRLRKEMVLARLGLALSA